MNTPACSVAIRQWIEEGGQLKDRNCEALKV
jgi:hypothetical protein